MKFTANNEILRVIPDDQGLAYDLSVCSSPDHAENIAIKLNSLMNKFKDAINLIPENSNMEEEQKINNVWEEFEEKITDLGKAIGTPESQEKLDDIYSSPHA